MLFVHFAAHVLALAVADYFMRKAWLEQTIAAVLIRSDERNVISDSAPNESIKRRSIRTFDNFADHVTFAADCADDCSLITHLAALDVSLLVPMAVFVLAADECLINFNDPHQLTKIGIGHSGAQPMADEPCRAVRAGADHAMNLKCADPLLAGQHQVQHFEPYQQLVIRVLKDSPDRNRETIGRPLCGSAFHALPMEG